MSPTTPSLSLAEIKQRDIELLNKTLSMLCNYIWTKNLRPGEHLWSIPVDKERDFDCILSDAIDELAARRALAAALPATTQVCKQVDPARLRAEVVLLTEPSHLSPDQVALHEQYVAAHADDHDDDCPGDDTCDCSMKARNDAVNMVCRFLTELWGHPGERTTCAWTEDENVGWKTSCGNFFQFNDGTPTENKQAFCGYCGLKLREVRYVDAPWGPE